jgi:hypothetical protein
MTAADLMIQYIPSAWPPVNWQPYCPMCNDTAPIATLGYLGENYADVTDHRWCLIHGFEQNKFQTKQEWIDQCVEMGRQKAGETKVKAKKVVRKVLLEDMFKSLSVSRD